MRKYLACVVGMPIPLRICLVETPTSRKVFSRQITEAQNVKHLLTYSSIRCIIVLRAQYSGTIIKLIYGKEVFYVLEFIKGTSHIYTIGRTD